MEKGMAAEIFDSSIKNPRNFLEDHQFFIDGECFVLEKACFLHDDDETTCSMKLKKVMKLEK